MTISPNYNTDIRSQLIRFRLDKLFDKKDQTSHNLKLSTFYSY